MSGNNVRMDRALGLDAMIMRLKKAGWTGEDLVAETTLLKNEGYKELDRFADGELSKLKGTPLYPLLLEATAIRYTLHKTERQTFVKAAPVNAPSECPHGYRMVNCNLCLGAAS